MSYDPNAYGLPEEDLAYLEMISEAFKAARLAQSATVVLQGHLLGKLLAEAEKRGIPWQQVAVSGLPAEITVARHAWGLTAADEKAIEYSRQHAATFITEMSDRSKAAIREDVTAAQAEKVAPMELARTLYDRHGQLNRDWRRIALTETATAVTNGYLATLPEGQIVVGDSASDACDWCLTHLHNRAFELLPEPPAAETEAVSWSAVWPGKSNVERSRYPRKANGEVRPAEEMWHPCIPAHPHCRCRWRRFIPSVEEIQDGNLVVDKVSLFT